MDWASSVYCPVGVDVGSRVRRGSLLGGSNVVTHFVGLLNISFVDLFLRLSYEEVVGEKTFGQYRDCRKRHTKINFLDFRLR